MNRKQFLGVAASAVAGRTAAGADQTAPEAARKVREQWTLALIENMEKRLDKPSRVALMEDCGRACANRGPVAGIAAPCRGEVAKLVERLGAKIGRENALLDGRTARITYTKCYCPIVGAGPERLPDTWCECSRGWLLEMFETVAGKPVKVELLESIKRGGQACRFLVRL